MTPVIVRTSPASEALRQSPIPALRSLVIDESKTQVRLSGSVASYYLKQLAQETVLPLLKERRLDNQITVVRV